MPANITCSDTTKKTYTSQAPQRAVSSIIKYTGNFGATEGAETQVDIIPVDAFRSVLLTVVASSWGTATVAIKLYPCDSQGNTIGSNPFFSFSLTANATTTVILAEMGGQVTATPYPPASPASSGSFIGAFGNFLKLTEQCTAFTSGTNTVAIELDCKG
jgi:hypothetical protein